MGLRPATESEQKSVDIVDGSAEQDDRWPPRLQALAQRLKAVEDFPAISGQVVRVMQIAEHEGQSLRALTDEILKDAALTNKLLRVVNAARYAGHQDGVGTVSRAISLLGVAAVQRVALGLMVLEHLENRYHAHWLRQAYLKTLLAAQVSVAWTAGQAEPEDAFLTTLFQQLGPLVALCHFPEVAANFEPTTTPTHPMLEAATQQVLGASLQELGSIAATLWTLPAAVQHAIVRPEGSAPVRPLRDGSERLRWVARAAADVADVLCDPAAQHAGDLERVTRSYLPVLGRPMESALACIATAQEQWAAAAAALGFANEFKPPPSQPGLPQGVVGTSQGQAGLVHGGAHGGATMSAETVLAQALDDVTAAMLEGAPSKDQARIALESICRALGLSRIVLCRRDRAAGTNGTLRLWLALGPQTETLQGRFQFQPGVADDPLSTLAAVGKDVWVPSVTKASWLQRLPAWLPPPRQGALLLLPLHHADKLVGAVYADGGDGRVMPAEIPARTLLQSVRRLLVMAVNAPG